jgi:phospholipid-transporting ATPase
LYPSLHYRQIPAISTTNGIPTEYSPLAVIIFVTALKDMYEDYQRHKNDNLENQRRVFVGDMSSKFKSTFKVTEILR